MGAPHTNFWVVYPGYGLGGGVALEACIARRTERLKNILVYNGWIFIKFVVYIFYIIVEI
jgi:hypothetical protein